MIDTFPFLLTREGQDFSFQLSESSNVELICFPAKVSDDLDWSVPLENLENLPAEKKALIHLDLGLDNGFSIEDELAFKSYMLAIDHLTKKVLSSKSEKIVGVLLYKGTALFEIFGNVDIDETIPEHFKSLFSQTFLQRLGMAYSLGMIFHRLVSFFPEGISIFALFDDHNEEMTSFEKAILFSHERFEHIFLIFAHSTFQYPALGLDRSVSPIGYYSQENQEPMLPSPMGLLLPSDECLNQEGKLKLETWIKTLESENQIFRIIPEKIFSESWNELKKVYALASGLHMMTERMLRGFIASGGEVVKI